jgi:hypothetical protein
MPVRLWLCAQGDVKKLMNDVDALKPTLFAGTVLLSSPPGDCQQLQV